MALRILIVDDEPLVRRSLSRQLRPHTVVEAAEGGAALEILAEQAPFDGILCDLLMQGMDGVTFLQELRRRDPAQADKVIILSGSPGQSPTPLDALGVRYEDKPLNAEQLQAIVDSWKS